MSEALKLGHIIEPDRTPEPEKDAIHIAVYPATAACLLLPGAHVGLLPDGRMGNAEKKVGIVDPFLVSCVNPGERFWVYLYPGSITSLRHDWTHPILTATAAEPERDSARDVAAFVHKVAANRRAKDKAENRLQEFANNLNCTLSELIDHATSYLDGGEYWSEGGRFDGVSMPNTFWADFETYTGKIVPGAWKNEDTYMGHFFSCSC